MKSEVILSGTLEGHSIEDRLRDVAGSWEARCIFALLSEPRFQASPREMAAELNITLDLLYAALDSLEFAGLIKRTASGGYTKIKKTFDVDKFDFDAFKATGTEILLRQSSGGPCKYEAIVVNTNKAILEKFIERQNTLLDEFVRESSESTDKGLLVGCLLAMADMVKTAGGSR